MYQKVRATKIDLLAAHLSLLNG